MKYWKKGNNEILATRKKLLKLTNLMKLELCSFVVFVMHTNYSKKPSFFCCIYYISYIYFKLIQNQSLINDYPLQINFLPMYTQEHVNCCQHTVISTINFQQPLLGTVARLFSHFFHTSVPSNIIKPIGSKRCNDVV